MAKNGESDIAKGYQRRGINDGKIGQGGQMKQTGENMPGSDISLWQYVIVLLVGIWAGAVSVWTKFKRNKLKRISAVEFVGEVFSSTFVTLMVFHIMIGIGLDQNIAVGVGGVMGHYGTRALFILQKSWLEWLRSKRLL